MNWQNPFHFLGERAIDLHGLETPVRRVIFTTLAVILGFAVATATRPFIHGTPYIAGPGIPIAPLVAWISCFGASLSFFLIIAGGGRIQSRWRYAAFCPLLAVSVYFASLSAPFHVLGSSNLPFILGCWLPLPFVAAGMAALVFGPKLKLATFLVIVGTLLASFIATAIAFSIVVWPSFGPSMIYWMVGAGAILLTPALLVVGSDIAEIGCEAAEGLMKHVAGRSKLIEQARRHVILIVGALVAVALELGQGLGNPKGFSLTLIWVVLAAIAAGTATILIRKRQAALSLAPVKFWTMLLVSIAVQLVGTLSLVWYEPQPGIFNYDYAGHQFSLKLPAGMKPNFTSQMLGRGSVYDDANVGFLTGKHLPALAVLGVVRPPFAAPRPLPTINDVMDIRSLQKMPMALSALRSDGWRSGDFMVPSEIKDGNFHFFVFAREEPTPVITTDMNWYIACGGTESKAQQTLNMCWQAADSFASEMAVQNSRRAAFILDGIMWLAALAVGICIWWKGRRRSCAAGFRLLGILAECVARAHRLLCGRDRRAVR
jgi:hypothetical protein